MSTLVIQPSFRALGQMQVKWQTFEKPENKRQMYVVRLGWTHYHTFVSYFSGFSNVCHSAGFLANSSETWLHY